MDARLEKARQIVATGKITRGHGCYYVPSQNGEGRYRVVLDGLFPSCDCADFELTGRPCKHMAACRYFEDIESGTVPENPPPTHIPRKTYPRDWVNYNKAQTTEKRWFLALLADLCGTIPRPAPQPRRGRPSIPLADRVFAACYKVYSGFSARRFNCDLEDAAEDGHISKAIHFNSVLNVFDDETVTPVLTDLIARSAAPLKEVEVEFAVDSSGFASSRFVRWYDEKYGAVKKEAAWTKAHICCGTRTNAIAAAEILDSDAADSPRLPGLVAKTAELFAVEQVTADKAYGGTENFKAVDAVGGTFYPAFRSNTTGGVGGLFEKAFHYFCLHREEYLRHYHRRSMIESTFSMLKAKFGDAVRSKTDTAMRNEVYAKFVCHNICCLVSAIYELGINPTFIGLPACTQKDEPAQIIRFPGA